MSWEYPLRVFSSLSAFKEPSLHSVLIKEEAWFVSHNSLIKGSSYLNDCSLVREDSGKRPAADQRRAAAALRLCLYSPIMCLIKGERDVEGAGGRGCCSKRYGFPSSPSEHVHTQICRVQGMLSYDFSREHQQRENTRGRSGSVPLLSGRRP